jgi:hypothetical protein
VEDGISISYSGFSSGGSMSSSMSGSGGGVPSSSSSSSSSGGSGSGMSIGSSGRSMSIGGSTATAGGGAPPPPKGETRPRAKIRGRSYRPTSEYFERQGISLRQSAFFGEQSSRRGQAKCVSVFATAVDSAVRTGGLDENQLELLRDALNDMMDTRSLMHAACHMARDAERWARVCVRGARGDSVSSGHWHRLLVCSTRVLFAVMAI